VVSTDGARGRARVPLGRDAVPGGRLRCALTPARGRSPAGAERNSTEFARRFSWRGSDAVGRRTHVTAVAYLRVTETPKGEYDAEEARWLLLAFRASASTSAGHISLIQPG
jgi:hypothetical protein